VNSYATLAQCNGLSVLAFQGGDPPVDVGDGDSGPTSMLSKADVQAYVQDSFTFIRRAISTITNHNAFDMIPHPYDPKSIKVERLTLGVGYACHGWEHYGNLSSMDGSSLSPALRADVVRLTKYPHSTL
jgi:hypothetical protein